MPNARKPADWDVAGLGGNKQVKPLPKTPMREQVQLKHSDHRLLSEYKKAEDTISVSSAAE